MKPTSLHKLVLLLGTIFWPASLVLTVPDKGITQAGKNESESTTISPGSPTDSWSTEIAPGFTASYTVNIESSGTAHGLNYTLKSGPTGSFSMPPNTLWTPDEAAMNTTYSILNTAKTAAQATMRVDVVWEPILEDGGEGGEGEGPSDIPGWAVLLPGL